MKEGLVGFLNCQWYEQVTSLTRLHLSLNKGVMGCTEFARQNVKKCTKTSRWYSRQRVELKGREVFCHGHCQAEEQDNDREGEEGQCEHVRAKGIERAAAGEEYSVFHGCENTRNKHNTIKNLYKTIN